jgi:hypothetical protein
LGGLVQYPGGELIATFLNPFDFHEGGIRHYNNESGE